GRDYVTPDGDEIVVFLLEFKTRSGATATYNNVVEGRIADTTVTGHFTVPGGRGFEWNKPDSTGFRESEMYKQVDAVVIILHVYTKGQISVSNDLQTLADQVDYLS